MWQHGQSALGIAAILLLAWACSENRRAFPVRTVITGLALQIVLAILLLEFPLARHMLLSLNGIVDALMTATRAGTSFVFGYAGGGDTPFAVTDPKALGTLCADDLSYSHSSGFLEDKAAFVANATDGKTEFLSITYKDPTIKIVGPAAIVRFHWLAEMMTGGQKVTNSLHILMNWLKQGDEWKLLSRSATKL